METYRLLCPTSSPYAASQLLSPTQSYGTLDRSVNELKMKAPISYSETKIGSQGMLTIGKKLKAGKKIKRHRYAFQTKSQVDVLDDGYRWRKYGQKAVKSSKFPRSYYRCSIRGCTVKKQVQRLSTDEEIVVTTYEGRHTHLPESSTTLPVY